MTVTDRNPTPALDFNPQPPPPPPPEPPRDPDYVSPETLTWLRRLEGSAAESALWTVLVRSLTPEQRQAARDLAEERLHERLADKPEYVRELVERARRFRDRQRATTEEAT